MYVFVNWTLYVLMALAVFILRKRKPDAERPFRVFLTAIEDQPPQIEVMLKGIGSAVTPDVIIPIRGKISDDYGIEKTWVSVQINESGDESQRPFSPGKGGAVETQIDFRNERTEKSGLDIKPRDKLPNPPPPGQGWTLNLQQRGGGLRGRRHDHIALRSFGSSRSRKPSPTICSDSAESMIATPGNTTSQIA